MQKLLALAILLLIASGVNAQSKKFLSGIDTAFTADTTLYQLTWEEFFASGVADEELNPYSIDNNLLNQTVFYTINKYRAEKNRKTLSFNSSLYNVSKSYIQYYSYRRFANTHDYKKKVNKKLIVVTKKCNYKGSLAFANIAALPVINYKKGKNYHYDKEADGDLKLFYKSKLTRKQIEAGEKAEPIPTHTYAQFAESLLIEWKKGFNNKHTYAKTLESMACYVQVSEKTLGKKTIPQVKAMVVFGGYRVNWE